ncbi:MAG: M4 family metallopeptidase [Rubrobacter sp.]
MHEDQSGALNESVSDEYGSLVKQYHKDNQAAEGADWLIGEGIWADPDRGKALRSMREPGAHSTGTRSLGTCATTSTP